jgi:hypothetical protein
MAGKLQTLIEISLRAHQRRSEIIIIIIKESAGNHKRE